MLISVVHNHSERADENHIQRYRQRYHPCLCLNLIWGLRGSQWIYILYLWVPQCSFKSCWRDHIYRLSHEFGTSQVCSCLVRKRLKVPIELTRKEWVTLVPEHLAVHTREPASAYRHEYLWKCSVGIGIHWNAVSLAWRGMETGRKMNFSAFSRESSCCWNTSVRSCRYNMFLPLEQSYRVAWTAVWWNHYSEKRRHNFVASYFWNQKPFAVFAETRNSRLFKITK